MIRNPQLSFILLVFPILSFFTSCTKDEVLSESRLTEQEVAEFIEASLAPSNGGMIMEMERTTKTMKSLSLKDYCGSTYADGFDYEYAGAKVQAFSQVAWNVDLTCNALNVPESSVIEIQSDLNFNTPRISSEGSSSFKGNLTGLELSSPAITWNGTYTRSGSQELSFRQLNSGTSNISLTLTDVVIDKLGQSTRSGSGAYGFTVTMNGTTQTYEGTISFNGDKTATIVVNGEEFIIDLN